MCPALLNLQGLSASCGTGWALLVGEFLHRTIVKWTPDPRPGYHVLSVSTFLKSEDSYPR